MKTGEKYINIRWGGKEKMNAKCLSGVHTDILEYEHPEHE